MRPDFNKTLVERERIHSKDHYHNYRHIKGPKGLIDDEVGGLEPMRKRFNVGYSRKSFSENLNPLYGWLRTCVGKNWDKCYSQLRRNFDTRSVINDHIMQHLWQSIEVNTYVDEHGRSMVRAGRRWPWRGDVPVSECGKDYYVCPKSGMVRATNKKSKAAIKKQKAAKEKAEKDKVERWIDDDNVLRLIDGVWYHFEVRDAPEVTVRYVKPPHKDIFVCGGWGKKVEKTWDEMNEHERREHGTKVVEGWARDLFTNEQVGQYEETARYGNRVSGAPKVLKVGKKRYHATRKTASHRQLKAAGLAV